MSIAWMKLSDSGVMQFVPANFEVPFGAINGVGSVIEKASDGFRMWEAMGHAGNKPDRLLTRDPFPLLLQALFIQEDNCEVCQVMPLDVLRG